MKMFLNKFCLGTANFGLNYGVIGKPKVDDNNIRLCLNFLEKEKINTIDTAIGYGDSEERLGNIGIKNFDVVSKLPPIPKDIKKIEDWAVSLFKSSLINTKKNFYYGFLFHKPSDLLTQDGKVIYNILKQLKKDNLIRKIGISIYSPEELSNLLDKYDFDLVQGPVNIFDQRLEKSDLLDELFRNKVEFHGRSIFLQGILLQQKQDLPKYFLRWKSLFSLWYDYLRENKICPIKACLGPLIKKKEINKLVIGVNNIDQLNSIIKIFKEIINGDEIMLPQNIFSNDQNLINPSKWDL